MRLIFAGTPEVAVPSLDMMATSGHDLVAVVTRPDAPSGRGRKLVRSPVGAWADERNIEVLTPSRPRDPEFLARLAELAPDCVPVVAYGALIPPVALAIPPRGWINLHFSLLPAWRGAAPVQWAVLTGDEMTGASVFAIEEGLDTGPIYGSLTEPIGPTDTSGDLLGRLSHYGARLLVDVLDAIQEGVMTPVAQPSHGVSLAPKLTVEDAAVRWNEPAFAVDRRIRACTPAPGAWTSLREERLRLGPVSVSLDEDGSGVDMAPGQVRLVKGRVLVGTATTAVVLGEVRAAGKKSMTADAWARGARLRDSDRLG